jgi:hypothetical protein
MRDNKLLLDNAQHWRRREEETRTLAEAMYNEETKARLLKIADEYARLAERAEQRLNDIVPNSQAGYGLTASKPRKR